jgi:hypothetical protein
VLETDGVKDLAVEAVLEAAHAIAEGAADLG